MLDVFLSHALSRYLRQALSVSLNNKPNWSMRFRDIPVSASPALGLQCTPPHLLLNTVGAEDPNSGS